jgi:hypothetical protein
MGGRQAGHDPGVERHDGYLSASVFTPGTFDIPTEHAVETFQCFENIACSDATPGYGTVGPKTRAALGM